MKKIIFLMPVYNDWESLNKLLKEIDFEFMTLEKGIKRVYDNFSKRHDR